MRVRLISCLPDSNKNSAGEFVRVNGNWLADKLPYPLSTHDIGRYRVLLLVLSLTLLFGLLVYVLTSLFIEFFAKGRQFRLDLRVVHVRDLNFVLRSEIFVHTDGQLRASYLILGCEPVYST